MIAQEKQKNNNQENGKRQRRLYRRFFMVVFLLIVAIIIYLIWQFLQKPVSSKIYTQSESPTAVAPEIFERFEGEYFSFRYNQVYSIKSHIKEPQKGGVILESALLSDGKIVPKGMAITVEDIQGRMMEDSGNFNMRKKNPKDYQEEKIEIEKTKITTFVSKKSVSFEKVFFIPRDNYLAEFAFTGPADSEDDFKAEISDIIKSIQWKK